MRRALFWTTAAGAVLLATGPVQAAETDVEEVVVTGSRIRGVEAVGSSVITLGSDQIAKQPSASVHDLLKTVPQVAGFGIDPSSAVVTGTSGTNTTRGSALNLRGLGSQATLVLLDGRRLPASGVNGTYVDPTSIPALALSRIEVVADGASAVYGSDAVAGVVNFIINKSFTGALSQVRAGYADGYDQRQFGQMLGHDWGGGRAMIAFEHAVNSNLNGSERSFIRSDLTADGGRDFRGSQCNPGNIVVAGVPYAIPAGGVTSATAASLVPNTRNRCETTRLADVLPKQRRDSVVLFAEQDLSDSLSVRLEGLYAKRKYVANAIQQGSSSVVSTFNVPSTNPFFVRPPGVTANTVSVEYFFGPELGLLRQHGFYRVTHLAGGFDIKLPAGWSATLDGFYGRTDEAQNTRRILPAALTAALTSRDPNTAFNPFGGANTAAARANLNTGLFYPYARNLISGGEATANGTLFDIAGGPVRLAVGAEYARYTLSAGSKQGAAAAPTFLFNSSSREQRALYGELLVPLVGSTNEMSGVRRLDVSLAYRIDDYDDVGSTRNPKIGVTWSPIDGLQLKGSYGTSFRAPLLQDLLLLRGGAALVVSTVPDPLSASGTSTGLAVNAGNPNLTPEEATSWSFTADWIPAFLPDARLSLTWFSVDYENQVSNPPRGSSTLLDPNYQFLVTRNPSPALIQSFTSQGLLINGILPPNVAWLQNAQTQNLAGTKVTGFDIDASYRWRGDFGQLVFGATGSYTDSFKIQISPVAPVLEQVGNLATPVKFRARAYIDWSNGPYAAVLTLNHSSGYDNALSTPVQRVERYDTIDLRMAYTVEDTAVKWFEGISVSLDVQNLFDQDPPYVNIDGGWDPGHASAVGRLVSMTVAKRW
jgi:iron complex outermembrane receptor protein